MAPVIKERGWDILCVVPETNQIFHGMNQMSEQKKDQGERYLESLGSISGYLW
jgi:hypothetical protein